MASPALFDPAGIAQRIAAGKAPQLVVLDQSAEDQLVAMNQKERMQTNLSAADSLRVEEGHRLSGEHAEAWEGGSMLWHSVRDVLDFLRDAR